MKVIIIASAVLNMVLLASILGATTSHAAEYGEGPYYVGGSDYWLSGRYSMVTGLLEIKEDVTLGGVEQLIASVPANLNYWAVVIDMGTINPAKEYNPRTVVAVVELGKTEANKYWYGTKDLDVKLQKGHWYAIGVAIHSSATKYWYLTIKNDVDLGWANYQSDVVYTSTNPPNEYVGICFSCDYQMYMRFYLKVVKDTTAPSVSVTGAPSNWANSATAQMSCSDETGCDSNTYKLKSYTSVPSTCSQDYSQYNLNAPYSVDSHEWICATAKDAAGNTGFSSPVEFKVEKNSPKVTIEISKSSGSTTANVKCADSESGCDTATFATKKYFSDVSSCPSDYSQYTIGASTSVSDSSNFLWICAAAKDNAGNVGFTSKPVKESSDLTPPVTSHSFSGTKGDNDWYKSPVTITLTCTDSGSGCDTTYYCINYLFEKCTPTTKYTSPFTTVVDGQAYIYYYSVDKNKNSESTKFTIAKVDSVPPSVTGGSPSGLVGTSTVAISVKTDQNGGTCKYSTTQGQDYNQMAEAMASSGTTHSKTLALNDGKHTFYIRCRDFVGNVNTKDYEVSFTVDARKPVVNIDSPAASTWTKGDFTLQYDATDDNIDRCSVSTNDGGGWVERYTDCGTDKKVTITIGPGKHCNVEGGNKCSVRVQAKDKTGNEDEIVRAFSLDISTPAFESLSHSPQSLGEETDVTITASFTDTGSGIADVKIFVDDKLMKTCDSSPCAYTSKYTGGLHKYYSEGMDKVGNKITTLARTFMVDLTPPVTVVSATSGGVAYTFDTWTQKNIEVSLTCTDLRSGCSLIKYCTGTTECVPDTAYSIPLTISDEGATHLSYMSIDKAGNVETAQRKVIKIDKTLPTISLVEHSPEIVLKDTDVTVRAQATDAIGELAYIQIYLDDQLKQDCNSPPISSCLYTARYTEGRHTYYAKVADKAGNVRESTLQSFRTVLPEKIQIVKGWNLISIPYTVFNIVLSTCDTGRDFYNYDAVARWTSVKSASGLQGGKGYWLYAEKDCEINVMGQTDISKSDIQLQDGWNHIGSIWNENLQSLKGECAVIENILYYDAATKRWESLDTADKLEAYRAYFVKAAGCHPAVDTGLGSPVVTPLSPTSGIEFQVSCPVNKNWECIEAHNKDTVESKCEFQKWDGVRKVFTCSAVGAGSHNAVCRTILNQENCKLDRKLTPYTVPPDSIPPKRSSGSPTGIVSSNIFLSLATDEAATCKYSTTSGIGYHGIESTFAETGVKTHIQELKGLSGGTYTYYVKCIDLSNNANTDDYEIKFSVVKDKGPPKISSLSVSPKSGNVGAIFKVTARIDDQAGISKASATITRGGTTLAQTQMYDDGVHGDGKASDNVYGALWSSDNMVWGQHEATVQAWSVTNEKISAVVLFDVLSDTLCRETIIGHNDMRNGRLNMVFTGINYDSMDKFKSHMKTAIDINGGEGGLMSQEPFKSNKDRFNFWYVDVLGTVGEGVCDPFKSTFNFNECFSVPRQLASECVMNKKNIVTFLDKEHLSVSFASFEDLSLVAVYGKWEPVINKVFTHETGGHSIGHLRDEYIFSGVIGETVYTGSPVSASNILYGVSCTSDENIWKDLIGWGCGEDNAIDCIKNIGVDNNGAQVASCQDEMSVYPCYVESTCVEGGGFYKTNTYRPSFNTIMRDVYHIPTKEFQHAFGPVNERIICDRIRTVTGYVSGTCESFPTSPSSNRQDLAVSELILSSETPKLNEKIDFQIKIENKGKKTSGEFKWYFDPGVKDVAIEFSGKSVNKISTSYYSTESGLGAGQSMTINGRLQITAYPDGGTTIFTVKVSPLSGNEINIANDALSKLVGVR